MRFFETSVFRLKTSLAISSNVEYPVSPIIFKIPHSNSFIFSSTSWNMSIKEPSAGEFLAFSLFFDFCRALIFFWCVVEAIELGVSCITCPSSSISFIIDCSSILASVSVEITDCIFLGSYSSLFFKDADLFSIEKSPLESFVFILMIWSCRLSICCLRSSAVFINFFSNSVLSELYCRNTSPVFFISLFMGMLDHEYSSPSFISSPSFAKISSQSSLVSFSVILNSLSLFSHCSFFLANSSW